MKVLFVSIAFGPPFQSDLMNAIAARGHEVVFYSAGLTTFSRKPRLRWERRGRILEAQLLNSGIVPGSSTDPTAQRGNREIDALTEQVLDQVRPDVVSVHELSAHGLSTLDVLRRRGVPYVVTLHNFWQICPQLNLVSADGQPCRDFHGGASCTRCRWLPEAQSRTAVERAKSALAKTPFFKPVRWVRRQTRQLISRDSGSAGPAGWGETRYTAEAFLQRRAHAVDGLNAASAIHAMSTRTAAVIAAHGVRSDHVRVVPISLSALDALRPVRRRPSDVITFGYRGLLAYIKGVQVLVSAFAALDQSRARLLIYGSGESEYEQGLRAMAKPLNVEFRGEYDPARLQEINAGIDVGVVPSVCDETFCLTGYEFIRTGTPVVAAEIGGMIDYVHHGVNGWLVPPGDVAALADRMRQLVDSPERISSLPMPEPGGSMSDTVDAMLALFRDAADPLAAREPSAFVAEARGR